MKKGQLTQPMTRFEFADRLVVPKNASFIHVPHWAKGDEYISDKEESEEEEKPEKTQVEKVASQISKAFRTYAGARDTDRDVGSSLSTAVSVFVCLELVLKLILL
jgi:hypothetical protein